MNKNELSLDFARSLGLIRRVMVDFVERDKEVTSHA